MADELPGNSFIRVLALDAERSLDRLKAEDTDSNRRETVRSLFCAIEGFSWMCREHVKTVAQDLDMLVPILEMALDEETYFVTESGKVKKQVRYISFTGMFRLVSDVAHQISPDYRTDFSGDGWSSVVDALALRNRLMHPKRLDDLIVSDQGMNSAIRAFEWTLETCLEIMSSTNASLVVYEKNARELIDGLLKGDEAILAQYQKALAEV